MRKAILNLFGCSLIVLFGFQIVPLRASDQLDAAQTEMARADNSARDSREASNTSSTSSAATATSIDEMKGQIYLQQKQIETLQSTLDQQKSQLDAALSDIAASPATAQTAAGSSSQATQNPAKTNADTSADKLAQNNLQASNASAPPSQSAADQKGTAGTTSQPAAQKLDLPAALKGFKPIGTFYISYQAGTQDSGANQTSDYNSFQLKRGYFGADVDITSYLTARFVSDVTLDSTGDVKLRAKYMYAKFHWTGDKAFTGPYMEFGLAHMPWLDFEESINGFRMQDTMFLERNNVFNSADVGVLFGSDLGGSMSGKFKSDVDNSHYAGRYGSWQVGIYNGGGYHAAEQNTNKVFEGRLSIRPVPGGAPGLQFTVFGIYGKGNKAVVNGIQPPDWRSFDGMISYESKYFTLTGQGYFGTGNQGGTALLSDGKTAADQKGFSVFAAVHIPTPKIGGKITLLGRADEFNSNTSIYNDLQRRYIVGVAWHIYKSNILLLDYQRTNHSVSTLQGEDRAQATVQTSF